MGKRRTKPNESQPAAELRIIGGRLRGRKLRYHGDPTTRPMKDRVREAIFNLISTEVEGRRAIDLFAGTGALGLEALSRGAASATFIERHVPTARLIAENIAALEANASTELLTTSALLWAKRDLPNADCGFPWLVFCSPPYAFYLDRQQEMLELIASLVVHSPAGSILVVEADERFDFALLPGGVAEKRHSAGWDVRSYPPAVVGVLRS